MCTSLTDNLLQCGTVVKLHGTQGEIIVRADDGFTIDFLDRHFVHIEIDRAPVPFEVEMFRPKSEMESIIKMKLVPSQDYARRLLGSKVFVDRSEAQLNSYADDADDDMAVGLLVGYEASDVDEGILGKIIRIDNMNGVNPLFVIEREDGRELLIPITEELINSIDQEQQTIEFCLPEGLTTLDE
ncbi:MAG: 16S rRNA processing protein RimM [Bacteroidales bacterium]|nr:16S rRNA processing protein RimM [Bacteroidales bacterium]